MQLENLENLKQGTLLELLKDREIKIYRVIHYNMHDMYKSYKINFILAAKCLKGKYLHGK